MSNQLPLKFLVNLYADEPSLEKELDCCLTNDRVVGRYYLEHLIISNLLLKIFSLLDETEQPQFFNLASGSTPNELEIKTWLDKHIADCTLTLQEVVARTLFALK